MILENTPGSQFEQSTFCLRALQGLTRYGFTLQKNVKYILIETLLVVRIPRFLFQDCRVSRRVVSFRHLIANNPVSRTDPPILIKWAIPFPFLGIILVFF